MIELHQERNNFDGKIISSEVKMKEPANERAFATWCEEHRRFNRGDMISLLYVLPELLYDFMMDTGRSVSFDKFGILKLRVRNGRVIVTFRNHHELVRRLMNEKYFIKHYQIIDGQKVIKGGRMSRIDDE